MPSTPFIAGTPAIHPDTRLGPIILRVSDVRQSAAFYQGVLGMRPAGAAIDAESAGLAAVDAESAALAAVDAESAALALGAADGVPLVTLQQTPGARSDPHASGLYHFAILLPSRGDLGRVLQRLIDTGTRFGQADHLVSEALYLSDPDGNGIEVYRDRPRSDWAWHGGRVEMTVAPLDMQGVLEEARGAADSLPPGHLPAGTRIGHIHLQVSDVEKAVGFYRDILGFEVTASWQGAAFLSAGGYHHHLGLNSWNTRGAPPAPAGSAGLESFTILAPSREEVEKIGRRLERAGVSTTRGESRLAARDPWNIGIQVETAAGR